MRSRLEQQSEYLEEIEARFRKQTIVRVEQDARDITSKDQLRSVARQLDDASLG
jgi:hypothetical protein